MKLNRPLMTIVCTAALSAAAFAQERPATTTHVSGTQTFRASIVGTCTNKDDFSFTGTQIGLMPSGAVRIHCVVSGLSTHGEYAAQLLSELHVTSNPCKDPRGAVGAEAVARGYVVVLSFPATGDQLFMAMGTGSSGSECLTPPGTIAGGKVTLNVIGGTGRYEGATGSVVNVLNPIALAFSALGGDGFLSAFSGTFDGSITLK
jgi:hypothetical protein